MMVKRSRTSGTTVYQTAINNSIGNAEFDACKFDEYKMDKRINDAKIVIV